MRRRPYTTTEGNEIGSVTVLVAFLLSVQVFQTRRTHELSMYFSAIACDLCLGISNDQMQEVQNQRDKLDKLQRADF
jgi:hypothetical protein